MKRDLVAVCAALWAALPLSMLAAGAGPVSYTHLTLPTSKTV